MTVRHDDQLSRTVWPLVPLALVGPALLLAYYLVAVDRGVSGGARTAAAGMAADAVVWGAAMAWLAVRRLRAGLHVDWRHPVLLLAIVPCVASSWMAFDLLWRGDVFGVWTALPVCALIAASPLLPVVAIGPTPPTEVTASTAPVAVSVLAPDEDLVEEVVEDGVEKIVEEAFEEAVIEDAEEAFEEVVEQFVEAVIEAAEPEPKDFAEIPEDARIEDTKPRPTDLAVGVDTEFWHGLVDALTVGTNGKEQGGVALTTVKDGLAVVVGVVLPPQTSASSIRCEFSVLDVERVRDALESLGPDQQDGIRITWLHTHPGLGVFLSSTDVDTSARWRSLDPDFRPIVVDVRGPELDEQIGVFGPDNRALRPVGLVDGALDRRAARAVERAVMDRYRREGVATPLVLVGGQRPRRHRADKAGR